VLRQEQSGKLRETLQPTLALFIDSFAHLFILPTILEPACRLSLKFVREDPCETCEATTILALSSICAACPSPYVHQTIN